MVEVPNPSNGVPQRLRIRFDCLIPPQIPKEVERRENGMSMVEVRKVLKAAQMETARSRLRSMEKDKISYAEFMKVCSEISSFDQGLGIAKSCSLGPISVEYKNDSVLMVLHDDGLHARPRNPLPPLDHRGQPDRIRGDVRIHLLLRQLRSQQHHIHRAGGDLPREAAVDMPWDIGGRGEARGNRGVVRFPVPGAEPGPEACSEMSGENQDEEQGGAEQA